MTQFQISKNIFSGFCIFLIALPLSIGIAIASGAPATAGLLAAVVGGIIGGIVGGSELTINGPAAGLIVIVMGAIQDLSAGDPVLGFKRTLAACVIAGLFQILFGVFRLGKYAVMIPTAVLHGMMAAIGLSIVAKQSHILFGAKPVAHSILGLYAELPHSFAHFNPDVFIVALFSAVILFLMTKTPKIFQQYFPIPLAVILGGVAMAQILGLDTNHFVSSHGEIFQSGSQFLLSIPSHLREFFITPDFSQIPHLVFWKWAITLSLVASIESQLSAVAIDRLDPKNRNSNLDRELISKGLCNTLLGIIGGLPIIAEIVRSTANIQSGATNRISNIAHGFFLLSFVILVPTYLHMIPLASLAVILVSIGFRLADVKQLSHLKAFGNIHVVSFLATLTVTLLEDLLVGIVIGLLIEIAYGLIKGESVPAFSHLKYTRHETPDTVTFEIKSPVLFTQWARLFSLISNKKNHKKVILNLQKSHFIDSSIVELLYRLQFQGYDDTKLTILYDDAHRGLSTHALSGKVKAKA